MLRLIYTQARKQVWLGNRCHRTPQALQHLSLETINSYGGYDTVIADKFKEILTALEESEKDSEKCDRGNASAGRRLRKACLKAMKDLKDLRAEIIADLNERQNKKDQW